MEQKYTRGVSWSTFEPTGKLGYFYHIYIGYFYHIYILVKAHPNILDGPLLKSLENEITRLSYNSIMY